VRSLLDLLGPSAMSAAVTADVISTRITIDATGEQTATSLRRSECTT
jgi:hypothetical protein